MNDNRRVDLAADKLMAIKKPSFLAAFFKKIILKKFKQVKFGFIKITDGDEEYYFGDEGSKLKANVEIFSSEFYVFLGSGGLLGVTESYTAGYWKSNNLVSLIRIVIQNKDVMNQLDSGWAKLFKPANNYIHRFRQNSLEGSKKNILAHYDLSNEFYQLWLDKTMTYSCGVFNNKSSTLQEASVEKLDRICRKLQLTERDSVLEIGTGWGSFAIHAAKHYGCNVTTTTISDAQYELAKERINQEGLASRITLLKDDYRRLTGQYDKIVSIEMIEAVGHEYVPVFFKTVSSLLKDDGLFALQGITYNDQNFDVYKNSVDFIKKYIFPGSCLISVSQVTEIMKKYTDLSIVHLEDITVHYATTLNIWRDNFKSNISSIEKLGFSSAFIKIWDLYFVYCEAGFRERHIGDYQFVFSKPEARRIKINY
jgi:cyclopropane-fatty-acyl-phospholipid synthase